MQRLEVARHQRRGRIGVAAPQQAHDLPVHAHGVFLGRRTVASQHGQHDVGEGIDQDHQHLVAGRLGQQAVEVDQLQATLGGTP